VVVPGTPEGTVSVDAYRAALQPATRLAVFLHASNVSGAILPIADLADAARESGAVVLIDAAQTAGHVPIDVGTLPIDLLACSGHKGLMGPLGTGVLYLRPGIEEHLRAARQGGTGSASEDDRQPSELPDKYESGNHNAPGLHGLEAGVDWVLRQGVARLHAHETEQVRRLGEGLARNSGLRVWGAPLSHDRVGVLSISLDGYDPHDLAAILDQTFGIETRAGLHCAPGAHRALGTLSSGGTSRLSVGPFTTDDHIAATVAAFRELTGG